jgi:capsule polysaccharide export protein KpsE/RkpR
MDFFNQQLASAKKAVNDAQSKLKDFAQKNGIVAGQQSQVIAGLTTQLQAQLVVAQAQLQAMSLYATTDNPDYKEVSAKVDAIRKQLNDISGQQTQSSNNPDSLPIPAGLAPELAQQYANLVRDVVLSDEILKVIAKQYEAAKIDALSEMAPTAIQIIDPAQVPLHKSKPQRLKIVLLCSIITLIICCVYVLIKNFKRIVIDV